MYHIKPIFPGRCEIYCLFLLFCSWSFKLRVLNVKRGLELFLNTTASVWTILDYFSLNGDNLNMQVNQCDAERYEIDLLFWDSNFIIE